MVGKYLRTFFSFNRNCEIQHYQGSFKNSFSEHSCFIFANCSSILSPSQCMGRDVKTIQISPAGLHSQFRHRRSRPLGTISDKNSRSGSRRPGGQGAGRYFYIKFLGTHLCNVYLEPISPSALVCIRSTSAQTKPLSN